MNTRARMHKDTTAAGAKPAANRAPVERLVAELIMIKAIDGGIDSLIAAAAHRSPAVSPSVCPLACIKGPTTGAVAAISAIFEPDIPDMIYTPMTLVIAAPPFIGRVIPSNIVMSARDIPGLLSCPPTRIKKGIATSTNDSRVFNMLPGIDRTVSEGLNAIIAVPAPAKVNDSGTPIKREIIKTKIMNISGAVSARRPNWSRNPNHIRHSVNAVIEILTMRVRTAWESIVTHAKRMMTAQASSNAT